ncbi:MAG: ribonuclease H-like domain-containing protein [Roseiflexaceae bacterium]
MRAYLDIETTHDRRISVIGIYRQDRGTIQLVDSAIRDGALYAALEGITTLVTFNGTGFDLPCIKQALRVNLQQDFSHSDLMYVCRKHGLRGGLKRIEVMTGIARDTAGITGSDAPRLWHLYEYNNDTRALELLLNYNQEDVINLYRLEAHLGIVSQTDTNVHVQRMFH